MTSSAQEIRRWVVDAVRDESVALAAEIDYDVWASSTAPRVFVGSVGYLGARNRGRLPFIDVIVSEQSFDNATGEGGAINTTVKLIMHDTGRDVETVHDRMHRTLSMALSVIRDNREGNFTQIGRDMINEIQPGPMGWSCEADIELEHSYDRDTYEAE